MSKREESFTFAGRGPGSCHEVVNLCFGDPAARPHVHVQGGLHADEGPGMMTARMLADLLAQAEREGRIHGRITVVPFANPLGLGQVVHGDHSGRFDLYDGRNFNRDYPDLTNEVAVCIADRLGENGDDNIRLIREAMAAALAQRSPVGPADTLRHHLMGIAISADVVLDLHCDGEAEMHLYTQPAAIERLAPLAALLGCRAVLLAEVSGGSPFDEAIGGPWQTLAERFEDRPIPVGCVTCTVELRGRSDVSRTLGLKDAGAILDYLVHLGVLKGSVDLPDALCKPTPLAGSEALSAPIAGLVSYVVELGAHVEQNDVVAEIVDLVTGMVIPVRASTSGIFYARPATRIAEVGKRLGKIAGAVAFRDGPLLSP